MGLRPFLSSIVSSLLLVGFMTASGGLRADEVDADPAAVIVKDPPPSLVVNKGQGSWAIRISDDVLPVGKVIFYDGDDADLSNGKALQSKDDTYPLGPGASVKIVICGTPFEPNGAAFKAAFSAVPKDKVEQVRKLLKDKIVALHLSLDRLDASGKVVEKSASRYHFVHGIMADNPKLGAASTLASFAPFKIPGAVTKLLDSKLPPVSKAQRGVWPMAKDTWDTTADGRKTIITKVDNYQNIDGGAFWTIEK